MRIIRILGYVALGSCILGVIGSACVNEWKVCFANASSMICWALLLWQDRVLFKQGWVECKRQIIDFSIGKESTTLGGLMEHLNDVFKDCYKKR